MPMLGLIAGCLAVGFNYFMIAALDHATVSAARAVATGAVSTAGMSASTFQQQVVCPRLPSVFTCSNVFVNMQVVAGGNSPSSFYSYVNSAQSGLIVPPLDSSKDTFCPGAGSQYVVLQVVYPAPVLVSFLSPSAPTTFNGQRVNVLMSSTTFKSEPYSGAQAYKGC